MTSTTRYTVIPTSFGRAFTFVTGNRKPEQDNPFSARLELVDPRPGASLTYQAPKLIP